MCNPLYLALKFKLHCCQNYVFCLNFSLATSEKKLHLTTDYWLTKFSICFCKRLQGSILGKYLCQQFISLTRKKLKGLLLVSLTGLVKLNFVLFWAKLHLFSKTLQKCKQRYLMNQKFIKGLMTYQP